MDLSKWLPNSLRNRTAEFELPRWNKTPSTPFPPLIMANQHRSPRSLSKKQEIRSDELLLLQRKEEALHEELQELLHVQSDGLLAGLGASPAEIQFSVGNLTPTTTQSIRSMSLSPPRSPRGRSLGLGAARRGIYKTILECAVVKEEMEHVIRREIQENHTVLGDLDAWDHKRARLHKDIAKIEGEDTAREVHIMKEEADKIQQEITEIEQRLSHMRSRHSKLLHQISDIENNVQSKLSGYKSSLAMLEKDVQSFLKNPPIKSSVLSRRDDSNFTSLPPSRRTLEMAKDYWEEEYTAMKRRRRKVKDDLTALNEGAVVWKEVISEITSFERFLRQQSKSLAPGGQKGKDPSTNDPAEVLSRMDTSISFVEERLRLAESKKWRLLMVSIGSELEAFRQARDVLEETFAEADDAENWETPLQQSRTGLNKDEDLVSIDANLDPHSAALHKAVYDTDEDEPSADLMLSQRDDDTDD